MGPQLTVLIIEVSLFQSVHNSRFDCIIILAFIIRCSDATSGSIDSCTNPLNRELGDSITSFTADICPLPPSVPLSDVGNNPTGALDDYNVYIAEELLRVSGDVLNVNDFFLRFQV